MCDKQITTSKGLRRHVLSIHFGEFLHYCIYCSFGRNEKHAVVSHTKSVHGMGCDYKCDKTDKCTAVFNSLFKFKRHQKYCGEEKAHACDQCNSKFMRLENLNHHIKIHPTGELEKVKCDFCLRLYQSVSSYRQHYKKGNCKRFEVEGEEDSSSSSESDNDGEGEKQEDLSHGVVYLILWTPYSVFGAKTEICECFMECSRF